MKVKSLDKKKQQTILSRDELKDFACIEILSKFVQRARELTKTYDDTKRAWQIVTDLSKLNVINPEWLSATHEFEF